MDVYKAKKTLLKQQKAHRKHVQKRVLERYGLVVTDIDIGQITRKIKQVNPNIDHDTKENTMWKVEVLGKEVVVVYSSSVQELVTVLPLHHSGKIRDITPKSDSLKTSILERVVNKKGKINNGITESFKEPVMGQEKQEGENEMGYSKVSDENLEKNIHEIGEKNAKIQNIVSKYALQIQDIVKPIYNAFNVGKPNSPVTGKAHFEIGKKEISLHKGYFYSDNRLYKKSCNLELRKYDQTNLLLDDNYTIEDAEIFIKDIESGLIDSVKNSIKKQNEKRDLILDMAEKLEGG